LRRAFHFVALSLIVEIYHESARVLPGRALAFKPTIIPRGSKTSDHQISIDHGPFLVNLGKFLAAKHDRHVRALGNRQVDCGSLSSLRENVK
jgi:hypothetical protein